MSYFRVMAKVSYDGTAYMGFQKQNGLDTIEDRLTSAISKIVNKDVKIFASGRTDKGVHARGQVIHFDLDKMIPEYNLKKGINTYLPIDIRIVEVKYVSEDFHARFSAIKKEYHYLISTDEYDVFKRNYFVFYNNLDIDLMNEAIILFKGTHNFKGFCSAEVDKRKDCTKTIYEAKIIENDNYLEFVFVGTGFLKYQVRRMMGILIDIGLRKDTKETIIKALELMDPSISHKKAEPQGLYLWNVSYE